MKIVTHCEVDREAAYLDYGDRKSTTEFATMRLTVKDRGIFYIEISRPRTGAKFETFEEFTDRFVEWIESQSLVFSSDLKPIQIVRYLNEKTKEWRVQCES